MHQLSGVIVTRCVSDACGSHEMQTGNGDDQPHFGHRVAEGLKALIRDMKQRVDASVIGYLKVKGVECDSVYNQRFHQRKSTNCCVVRMFMEECLDKIVKVENIIEADSLKTLPGNIKNHNNRTEAELWLGPYTCRTGEGSYGGSKPLCSLKCNYHHDGHVALSLSLLAKFHDDLEPLCFEWWSSRTLQEGMSQSWKYNKKPGNQVRCNDRAPAKVYVVGRVGTNPDSNIVMGTFFLNNRYASILFDTGADRSFVSTAFRLNAIRSGACTNPGLTVKDCDEFIAYYRCS
ncbi:putative reverse transcriptase domain-containing protein [Tanacetum coccineum]